MQDWSRISRADRGDDTLPLSEPSFELLANTLPQPIGVCSTQGDASFFNRRWFEVTGLNELESLGFGWQSVIDSHDQKTLEAAWSNQIGRGLPLEMTCRLRIKGSQPRSFRLNATPMVERSRATVGVCLALTEIESPLAVAPQPRVDERPQAHQGVAWPIVEARYRDIFDDSPFGIWIVDTEGRLLEFNDVAHRQLGYTREELAELTLHQIEANESPEMIASHLALIMRKGAESFETKHRAKSGELRDVLVTVHLHDLDGQPIFHCILLDVTERRIAERLLIAKRKRLQHALDRALMTAFFWQFTSEPLSSLDANSSTKPRPIASVIEQVYPADRDLFLEKIQEALDSPDGSYRSEHRVVEPDGSIGWRSEWGRVTVDDSGHAKRLDGLSMDITERRHIETALRDREMELHRLVHNPVVGIIVCDDDGKIIEANETFLRIVGRSTNDLCDGRLNWAEITPSEYEILDQKAREELAQSGVCTPVRKEFLRPDASRVPVLISAAMLDGETSRQVAYVLDLSALDQVQEDLDRANDILNVISDSTEDAIFVKDRDCRMIFANPATVTNIGLNEAEILGRSEVDWHSDSLEAQTIVENDRRIMESGKTEVVEETFTTPMGLRVYLATKSPWRDRRGEVIGLVGVARDITDRLRAEEELREADRRKDQFLATLSHEMRSPLAAISNAVHVARHPNCEPADLRWSLGVIDRQSNQLARLVGDLMDVSRIAQGKLELQHQPTQLRTVISRSIESLRQLIEERRHTVTFTYSAAGTQVEADPARLEQVFVNLLTNAAKYTDPGGKIAINLAEENDEAVVRMSDTGLGISPEMLPRIFGLYTQVDSTSERSRGGLGIGLTLVKQLVELHGGSVSAASEGQGKGSLFTVRLPISSGRPATRSHTTN